MALSEEQRAHLLNTTRDAANALVEDMEYLGEVVAKKDTSRRDIRHLSAILRRLIVESDIAIVASPRMGKITLTAPDNRPHYRVEEKVPFLLFLSGGAAIFDGRIDRISAFDLQKPHWISPDDFAKQLQKKLPSDDDVTQTQLNLDQFAQQRVICYRGQWVTRQQVIKYMANISSGVHSGAPTDKVDQTLANMRSSTGVSLEDGKGLHLDLFRHGIDRDELAISHTQESIDLVLVETLAAATWLTRSPRLDELVAMIRSELGLPVKAPGMQKE
ncbi:hypothetical protein FJ934_04775 [Mesorhizobium sp. B2-4-12]|uniref:hypothetical protein n=1 Tax=Mesorhizobium sp. B2-4-12 TaxID=2589937 RepID=UPI001126A55D|nr:hypothetical protein [Mesorhizobium sp. B2-4-12]TPK98048.1 hypothetical protein FJ934_04775 [Mesorhizobium sp. B2-4-12]